MENLLKYLFPIKCIFCGSNGDIFCEKCLSECPLIMNQHCIVCDRISEDGMTHVVCRERYQQEAPTRLLSVYSYEGKVRQCIKFSKYGARQFMSLRRLSAEAAGLAEEMWGNLSMDLCLPIPSSPKKLNFRGFNQANMIAEEIAKRFSIPIRKDILLRGKDTKAQHSLSREKRVENIKGSFNVAIPVDIKGKRILLVDDIATTGSTFVESSKVLYEAGAREICCFALSKREKFCYND